MNWFVGSSLGEQPVEGQLIFFLEIYAQIVIQECNWRGLHFSNLPLVDTQKRKINATVNIFLSFGIYTKEKKFENPSGLRLGLLFLWDLRHRNAC